MLVILAGSVALVWQQETCNAVQHLQIRRASASFARPWVSMLAHM